MDRIFKESRRWYSKRGAQRGLVLALVILGFWCSWAVGYLQGVKHLEQKTFKKISSLVTGKSLMRANLGLDENRVNQYCLKKRGVWT